MKTKDVLLGVVLIFAVAGIILISCVIEEGNKKQSSLDCRNGHVSVVVTKVEWNPCWVYVHHKCTHCGKTSLESYYDRETLGSIRNKVEF